MRIVLPALFIFGLSLILSFPNMVQAQERSNYVTFKVGGFLPTDDLDDADFGNGLSREISYGRFIFSFAALELGIGYFESDMSLQDSGYPSPGLVKEDNDLTVIPVTLTLKAFYTLDKVDFYGGVGTGYYFADIDGKMTLSGYDEVSMSDNDSVMGYHFVIGVNYNPSEKVFIGLEGKGTWTEDGTFQDKFVGTPVTVETNLNGYTASLVVGFRF